MKKNIPWDLIIATLKEEYTDEEHAAMQHWLSGPENQKLYNELETLWNEVRSEVAGYEPDTAYYWKIMERRMHRKDKKRYTFSFRQLRMGGVAAAVLFVLAFAGVYRLGEAARLQATTMQTYASLNGKSKMLLPDSTVVWLNTDSEITYSTAFVQNRQVTLHGEALFEVKKDTEHPFIVTAGELKVKVHGTRFNVTSYDVEPATKIALLQGSVSILTGESRESFLCPGDMAVYSKEDGSLKIARANVALESFWAGETVRFKAKPLSYIVPYIEKWYNVKIQLDPAIPDSEAYTFTIKKDDPLEVILRVMAQINPVAYSFEENRNIKIMYVPPLNQ